MSARQPIDLSLYVRMFPLDVPSTVALVVRLMGLVPHSKSARDKEVIARIRPSATDLRDRGTGLQQAWQIRDERGTTKLRPLDIDWDAAWSALLARIEPWAIFSAVSAHAIEAEKAAMIVDLLFENRLDFTRLPLNPQWTEGQKRISWIESKKLRPDLVKLAGEPFVGRVEETHERLGRALGLLGDPPDPDLPLVADVATAKRAAHDAITAYALQLAAADPVASDDISGQIRASLAAIDEFRPRVRRGAEDEGADDTDVVEPVTPPVDPSTPIPPLPE